MKPAASLRPWYREPWCWLVLSPLILVVLVSSVTVTIALSGADDVVSDNYYKEGRMLEQQFTADDYAHSLGLQAELRVDVVSGDLTLQLNQDVDIDRLHLLLSHPAEAQQDLTLSLHAVNGHFFRADLDRAIAGRWYLRASAFVAEQERWRLHGEIHLDQQQQVTLR